VIETRRLIIPADDFKSAFPGLNFRNRRTLVTAGEKVLLVDPTYIADVYNSADELASFLRDKGLFLMDFGGDTATPVWWKPPFLVMPISMHLSGDDLKPPKGVKVLAKEIECDSGSFVFLPLSSTLPSSVRRKVKEVLDGMHAVSIRLPAGRWMACYEQFEPPQKNMVGLYRNIVLKHTPIGGVVAQHKDEGRGSK
jgi:hypothetical protein